MQISNITSLNWADYTIICILALSVIISLARGFIKEVFSLITWFVAFWIGFKFCSTFSVFLEAYIKTPSIRLVAAFAILFIATLIVGSILNFLFSQMITKSGLSGTDRMLGMIFGIVRGVLLVGVVLLMASMTAFNQDIWWKNSVLIPHFQWVMVWLKGFLPDKIADLSQLTPHL
jgi:membrane protein required for colicin V production